MPKGQLVEEMDCQSPPTSGLPSLPTPDSSQLGGRIWQSLNHRGPCNLGYGVFEFGTAESPRTILSKRT